MTFGTQMATKTCTIKRVLDLDLGTGQTSLPANYLPDLPCSPMMAMDDIAVVSARAQGIGSAMVGRFQVFVFADVQIQRGDFLIHTDYLGKEIAIIETYRWEPINRTSNPFIFLVVNDPQSPVETQEVFER